MTRRRKMQLISVTIATILVLGGTTVSGYLLAGKYRSSLEYGYRRALSDLGDYVSNIESTLTKATYANTPPQQNGIAAKLMRESSGAKAALASLPLSGTELSNINKFIAQVGDFSMSLSNKVSAGGKITEQEYQNLKSLEKYARSLVESIDDVQSKFSDGTLWIGEAETLLNNLEESAEPVLSDNFEEASKDFADYPTLIYDGPFSDHIGQQKPKFLEGESEILQGNAQAVAAEYFGVTPTELSHTADTEGNLPTYNFTLGDSRISVTKAGGHIASVMNPREITENRLDYQQALEKAQEFFTSRGISGLKESYYVINDNKCTLNFAYTENDIVYYPDLIKVSVALDNGEVVEYNAAGFLMNHTDREPMAPQLTQEQAQSSVSPYLTVEKGGLAVIPTAGLHEVLCWEFLCADQDGNQVLVYINASTGYEEQILILISSDQGVLTK